MRSLRKFGFIFIILHSACVLKAQPGNCIFKSPQITINFGSGNVPDPNISRLSNYRRVSMSCPSDGYYSLAPYTSECFRGDWHTLAEDHTPGDVDGNMLLVNVAPEGGIFLRTPVNGLKSNTMYELCLWLINLCRPTKKCPVLLLPEINVRLETPEGKTVTSVVTGNLPRVSEPRWSPYRAYFTTPASASTLMLVMSDNAPGGCGNDFALDDITFRECIKQTIQVTTTLKTTSTIKRSTTKPPPKEITTPQENKVKVIPVITRKPDTTSTTITAVQQPQKIPAAPLILKTRENELVRKIETEAGEIKIAVYDNGVIDGDTVSIYHNNELVRSHMRLSQEPITLNIDIDASQPHHEIIMVADNLGSIPPNTSVMIITTASNRYELNISSSEQKNAKVVFDLKR
jgi:hypothetical protein